ncbi:MAG: hypothetical protein KAX15_03850 [Candidatus Omnitrophica bacterium]|nr:hypothetical protein [Candidatus Omnitrophota bacterium]
MGNNNVYKKKGEPLSKDDRTKGSDMITWCKGRIEKYKKEAADLEDLNAKSRAIIKEHEDEINKIETPAAGGLDPDQKGEQGREELGGEATRRKRIIKYEQEKILKNQSLISLARDNARYYWRELKGYKPLVPEETPGEFVIVVDPRD